MNIFIKIQINVNINSPPLKSRFSEKDYHRLFAVYCLSAGFSSWLCSALAAGAGLSLNKPTKRPEKLPAFSSACLRLFSKSSLEMPFTDNMQSMRSCRSIKAPNELYCTTSPQASCRRLPSISIYSQSVLMVMVSIDLPCSANFSGILLLINLYTIEYNPFFRLLYYTV